MFKMYPVNEKPEPISDSQRKIIKSICEVCEIEFTGTTKYEATQFIKDNISMYEDIMLGYDLYYGDYLNG